jgi:transmembrane sensor
MPESNQIDKRVQEQAAAYFLDLQDGTMTAEELQAWQDWMLASSEHRRAFARLETLMGVLDGADEEDIRALEVDAAPTADPVASGPETPSRAAGSSVLSLMAPSDARTREKERGYAWVGAVAASIMAAFVAGYMLLGAMGPDQAVREFRLETAATEQRAVTLTDGSIVELGSGSSVSVEYTPDERRLYLQQGEAVFTVAKNPKRPFVVHAGNGSVTAVGTVFNVRKSAANVEVRVLEGTVAVRPALEHTGRAGRSPNTQQVALVTAGRTTRYSAAGYIAPVVEADVHHGLDWRVGVLTMVDWPIEDVIEELNRYLADEITIGDEGVGAMRFTGTVYPDQVDAWLEGLQEGYPIEVVRLGGSTILMMSENSAGTLAQ